MYVNFDNIYLLIFKSCTFAHILYTKSKVKLIYVNINIDFKFIQE